MSIRFSDFHFRGEIARALDDANFDIPTPIQQDAIPILLHGDDLIGVAETGTGKTLAFLLPIYQQIKPDPLDPRALVICPTRELAIQVAKEADRFGAYLGIRTVLAYGGTSSGDQKRQLAEGCDLVVGTPGRLLDFVTSAWLSLRKLRYLVLDEADRMLDMGFIDDVDAILRKSPMSRQTALFSATFPEELRRLSDRYMLHPTTVRMHEGTQVTQQVEHVFYPVSHDQKESLLLEILRRENPGKTLIFTATREATSEVGLVLRKRRHDVISLSSLLSQPNRERALDQFRSGLCNVLVATDVAARGLDIFDIDLVVNFDVPMQAEDYVHRIGRTGRAGREGKAITLVSELDSRRTGDIERLLGQKIARVQLDGFDYRPIPTGKGRGNPRRGNSRGPGSRKPGGPGGRGGKGTASPGPRRPGGRGGAGSSGR